MPNQVSVSIVLPILFHHVGDGWSKSKNQVKHGKVPQSRNIQTSEPGLNFQLVSSILFEIVDTHDEVLTFT